MNDSKRMRASYVTSNNIKELESNLNRLEMDDQTKSVLFLMADKDRYSEELLIPILQKIKKPIIGGVFPELIYMGERKESGVLLLALSFELNTQLFNLSESSNDFFNQLESVQKDSLDPSSALFVFIDALSGSKEIFIESLFNFFGINPTYIGGGAGSLKFESFPCIITNNGIFSDAAVIGWANMKIALGVAHGWQSISPLLKVTEAKKKLLKSINWKPAFKVYKDIVELHSGMKFTDNNFFHIAKSYPLGISKMDSEMVVRDPYMVSDNVLHLVDNVNEGEYIRILHGNMDSLLDGALNAREISFLNTDESMDKKSIFCIDCISRVLYMQNDFKKELTIIGQDATVNGILPIGEIANSGESFLEIYNKTIVIAIC